MNCGSLETEIALYVEGDLEAPRAARLETHLAACARCREVAESLRESQALLKTLAPPEELYVSVVWAPEMRRRRDWWPWLIPVAAAIVLAALLLRPQPAPVPPPPAPVLARIPAPPAPVVAKARPVHHRGRIKPRPAQPLLITLETADPNVVIYWIVDQKGD